MFIAYVCSKDSCTPSGYLVKLSSSNKEDTLKELETFLIGKYNEKDNNFEDGLSMDFNKVTLYEVLSSEEIPIKEWKQKACDIMIGVEKQQSEEIERREFERLNKKFGKK